MWTTIANDMGPGVIGVAIVGMVGFTVGIFFYYLTDMITGIGKLKVMAQAKGNSVGVKRLTQIKEVLLWISVLAGIGAGYEALHLIVWFYASNQHAIQAGSGGPLPPNFLPVESAQQIYAHNIQSIWWGMLYWLILVVLAVGIGSAMLSIHTYFWAKAVNWVNKDRGE